MIPKAETLSRSHLALFWQPSLIFDLHVRRVLPGRQQPHPSILQQQSHTFERPNLEDEMAPQLNHFVAGPEDGADLTSGLGVSVKPRPLKGVPGGPVVASRFAVGEGVFLEDLLPPV